MIKNLSFGKRVGISYLFLILCFHVTLLSTPDFPKETFEETIACDADGGYLTDSWARTSRVICAGDGNTDAFDVLLSGTSGSKSGWVITDPNGKILGIPPGPPFDLEGAGPGTCLIWHLSYEEGLMGLQVGKNANDLVGCYDLSNPYTVYRNGVNGGTISTNDPTHICAGDGEDDFINVSVMGAEGPTSGWVITDPYGKILGVPAAPPFNFEGAGQGTCLIWHVSSEGPLVGIQVGKNANDIRGCYDLSNPITVTRLVGEDCSATCDVDGGHLTTAGGMTEKTICAGDGISDAFGVNLNGQSGSNAAWVITDAYGNILGIPPGPPFDLEGAGQGICLIWHLSYEDGLMGAEVGKNANDLVGCYDLSNPITVTRLVGEDCPATCDVDGGYISTNDATTICAGDGDDDFINVALSGGNGENSAWIITDTGGKILGLPAAPPFNFEDAGAGVCLIWHMRFDGTLSGVEMGKNTANIEGCYDLSNAIKVIRKTTGYVCSSYHNNGYSLSVALSPNPADDQIRLDINIGEGSTFPTTTIEIITALGRRVYRSTETTYEGDNTVNLTVSNLQPGVYFVRVKNGNQRELVRFIKQ